MRLEEILELVDTARKPTGLVVVLFRRREHGILIALRQFIVFILGCLRVEAIWRPAGAELIHFRGRAVRRVRGDIVLVEIVEAIFLTVGSWETGQNKVIVLLVLLEHEVLIF